MTTREIVLETKDVTMKFGGLTAVHDFNIQVEKGQITGLIGPNGAGKTTCFNMITGFYKPTEGSISFRGEDITGWRPHWVCKAGIARTFQNIRLFAGGTVLQNVMVGAHLRQKTTWWHAMLSLPSFFREEKEIREKSYGLLEAVGLADLANEDAQGLPYGAQRRLEIARALATEPHFLPSTSQVSFLHSLVFQEILSVSLKNDLANLEDIGVMCNPERRKGILLDEKYRFPLLVYGFDNLKDFFDQEGGKPQGWLVKHDQFWRAHKRPSDCEHLLLAPRQGAALLPKPLLQPWKKFVDPLQVPFDVFFVVSAVGTQHEIVQNAEVGEDSSSFGAHDDTGLDHVLGEQPFEGFPFIQDFTLCFAHESGNGPQSRAFPCSIRSNEGDDFPPGDLK